MIELKNKRVLVVGLGKSGLAAAHFLKEQGALVTVSDSRSASALSAELPALLEAGIAVETGGHGVLTFRRQDLLVVSPGVPLNTEEIAYAMAAGVPVIGEVELASYFLKGQIIAVTGSNGKTTTTSLIGHILKTAGLPTLVGGNIGTPVLNLRRVSTHKHWVVLEVSSFQLETVTHFHPKIAVVLNITPDHLDRHGTFEAYAAAKYRITIAQEPSDCLVLNAEDVPTQLTASHTKAGIYWFSPSRQIKQGAFVHGDGIYFKQKEGHRPEPIMPISEIPLKGAHNIENVLAAITAARLAGVPKEQVRAGVASFKAVEHRLEFVRKVNGVDYYNDSKATNVDATVKALESFPKGIHLILGGKDKDSDYRTLVPLLKDRAVAVYTIGSAAEKIESHLNKVVNIVSAGTLENALAQAKEAAQPGEVVLLAPACASFDQFQSYEHRGRVFKETVNGWAE